MSPAYCTGRNESIHHGLGLNLSSSLIKDTEEYYNMTEYSQLTYLQVYLLTSPS